MMLFSITLLSLTAVSCSPSVPDKSSESIYGGAKSAPGAWPNVVAILSEEGGMSCSGTAITPTVVITAAHCLEGPASSLSVYVGNGEERGAMSGQYQAVKANAEPRVGKSVAGHDVAYIVLEKPIDLPADAFTPVLTNESEKQELLAIGAAADLVGFGERDDGGFGVKSEVRATITAKNDLEINIGGEGKDSCSGDSGGPAFGQLPNGQWRVYGVTSRGGLCGTGGIYGLMHAHICWVQSDSGVDLGLPAGTCS